MRNRSRLFSEPETLNAELLHRGLRLDSTMMQRPMHHVHGLQSHPLSYTRSVVASPTTIIASASSLKLVSINSLQCSCALSNGISPTTQTMKSGPDTKVEKLRSWLKALNHDDCNLKVERCPQGTSGSGYGAVAGPCGVAEGSVVVRVPKKALMTEDTAAQCKDVGPLVKKANLTPWQAMCLHLLCERARGKKSFWYPYIEVLPTELELVGAHPMLWPERLRKEWLEGSPMLEVTEQRLSICREDHEAMLMAGADVLAPSGHASTGFITESAVRWAASILLSRSFFLNLQDKRSTGGSFSEETIALVPWADMLNHSSSAGRESCLVYNQRTGIASLKAHRAYAEGEQVYDSYGPSLSASKLLLDYGFVDEENSIFSVDLPASILGPVKSKVNELLLQAVGLPVDGAIFSLTAAGVDESVLAWTRAAVASPEELASVGWTEGALKKANGLASASRAMFHFSMPVSKENETEVLRRLLWACEDLSKRYPTTYEQDADLLAAANSEKSKALPWARRQAIRALMSEKLALKGARHTFWEALKNPRSKAPL